VAGFEKMAPDPAEFIHTVVEASSHMIIGHDP
jgi:hypothetical protein